MLLAVGFVFAQSPDQIIEKARSQTTIDNIVTQAVLSMHNGAGKLETQLGIVQYTSVAADGAQRTLVEIKAGPAGYKNNRYLMNTKADGTSEIKVFMSALNKVQTISAATSGSGQFFGTDFSYDDMAFLTRPYGIDTYKMLEEVEYKGKKCYQIESKPKNEGEEYSRTVSFIDKESNLILKSEFYDKSGTMIKRIELNDYADASGVLTPKTVKMTTLSNGHTTTIEIKKIQYVTKIPEGIFTQKYLETGRQ